MAAENPFAQVDLGDVDTTAQAVSAENGTAGVATNGKQGGIDQGKAEPGAAFEPLEIELEETTGDASWPQASCHTVTAVVGAGVLGLPYAFSYLGWVAGPLFLALAASTSYYTSWQLAGMHERDGKRLNRYRDLGVDVLGPVWGRWAIVPFQFMVMIGLAITYTVTAADSMAVIEELHKSTDAQPVMVGLTKYVFIFGAAQAALSQIPNFKHLWWVSIIGATMSLGYSFLAGVLAISASRQEDFDQQYSRRDPENDSHFIRGVFTALGAVTFAYGGHSVLLEIQATLRAPPPPFRSMMKGVSAAYLVSTSCYFFVALTGFGSYGNVVAPDVLLSRPRTSKAWIGVANMMVWLHVLAAYQVFSQPIFEALEKILAKAFRRLEHSARWAASPATWLLAHWWVPRAVIRVQYVVVITLVAATFPFFADLMGLIGAVGFIPMTFVMPAVLYLVAHRGQLSVGVRVLNWAIIVVFCIVGLSSFVASADSIAEKSRNYDLWN